MNLRPDEWQSPSSDPLLEEGVIHIWRAALDHEPALRETLYETLSADEKQKAGKFYFEKDRARFVAARGTLRKILGRYLNLLPGQISFSYNRYGKPALKTAAEHSLLCFNASHSHDLALFAVAQNLEVGIDIEFISDRLASLKVAEKFFSEADVSALKALPADLQPAAFFTGWTRKEAYLKALGAGLSYPEIKQLSVSVMPEKPAVLSIADDFHKDRPWTLMTLPAAPGYTAALAAAGPVKKVSCWQWSGK